MRSTRNPKKNALAIKGAFGPWDSVESGFPWAFYQVEVLLLLKHLKIPARFYSRAIRLLSQAPPKPLAKRDRDFLKQVGQLTNAERRSCCWINSAGVYLRDGHALFTNPWKQGKTLFHNNPIGWLSNALFCIKDEWLRITPGSFGTGFFRCDALAFSPKKANGEPSTELVAPWLYTGGGDYRPCLGKLRNDWWHQDMVQSYGAASESITKAWLRQAPGAVRTNPVYRFIANPSAPLRREASLFMRLVLGDGVPCIKESSEPPPQFKGPVRCSKRALNRALTKNPRATFVDHNLLTPTNPSGLIWQRPDRQRKSKLHEYWFVHESHFQCAQREARGLV